MATYLKTLAAALCIFTILLHLLPQGKFTKYVKFYAGLLFFLIAAGPLFSFFSGEGELERLLQLEFLKEEYYDLETAAAGMEELRDERILESYRNAILQQVKGIASAYGTEITDIQLAFESEDSYLLTGVSFAVLAEAAGSEAVAMIRSEIAGVYMLQVGDVKIIERGT